MGLDGQIGMFTVNLKHNKIKVSAGHRVISARDGTYEIESSRYPFCACSAPPTAAEYPDCGQDDVSSDQSIRSGMTVVPFNEDLNRLMLVVKNGTAQYYTLTWGDDQKVFTTTQLTHGVNLAAEFPHNPFTDAFARVDAAVAAKQAFETDEIKNQFEAQDEHLTRAEISQRTEQAVGSAEVIHAQLAAAIAAAFVPVTYTLKIEAD
jgi:hypothetical protein